jgi:hypothetical protein
MKTNRLFTIVLALIYFNAKPGLAQAPQSGIYISTGVFHSMVADYPFSPYLLKGAAPLIKVDASWYNKRSQDLMASVARPRLRPGEIEETNASSWFATLHCSFLPAIIASQRWHLWAGPSVTARGSHRDLDEVSGEAIISLDAKIKLRVPVNAKSHFAGSIFVPFISFVAYQGYALGNEETDWASFSELQSVTAEISYSRLIRQRLSFQCAYEFMLYQYSFAEEKAVITQQLQVGLTWHFRPNKIAKNEI